MNDASDGNDLGGGASLGRSLLALLKRASAPRMVLPGRLFRLASHSPSGLFLIALTAAGCGMGVIMTLNAEAKDLADRDYSVLLAIAFIIMLTGQKISEASLTRQAAKAIEEALHDRRVDISQKYLQLNLSDVEAISRAETINGLSRSFEDVSQGLVPIIMGFQSIILLAFMVLYLFWQSLVAGAITVALSAILIHGYLARARVLNELMTSSAAAGRDLNEIVGEAYSGFKELRLSPRKSRMLGLDLVHSSSVLAGTRAATANLFGEMKTTANSTSYLLSGAVTFVLPILVASAESETSRLVTTVLLMLGPLGGLVGAAQQFTIVRFALDSIDAFEAQLDARMIDPATLADTAEKYESLELIDICYSHETTNDKRGFSIKDIRLNLGCGEIVFITGGNGSGKTTCLRVLTGLYSPGSGRIILNGTPVIAGKCDAYREMFSTVFADCHVFRKPYGLDDEGIRRLEANLERFGIRDKLPADLKGGYDPRALSTGQRKRLALAIAIAEERPILVLDEWAADQDPVHRERFYKDILPQLKESGRTIVAVTHDERYFEIADRRFHMADGKLEEVI